MQMERVLEILHTLAAQEAGAGVRRIAARSSGQSVRWRPAAMGLRFQESSLGGAGSISRGEMATMPPESTFV